MTKDCLQGFREQGCPPSHQSSWSAWDVVCRWILNWGQNFSLRWTPSLILYLFNLYFEKERWSFWSASNLYFPLSTKIPIWSWGGGSTPCALLTTSIENQNLLLRGTPSAFFYSFRFGDSYHISELWELVFIFHIYKVSIENQHLLLRWTPSAILLITSRYSSDSGSLDGCNK